MSDETTTPDYTPVTSGLDHSPVYPLQSLSHGRDRTLFASQYGGLTLRQWFAGQAMSGLLANSAGTIPPGRNRQELPGIVATAAVLIADALIRELKGGGT